MSATLDNACKKESALQKKIKRKIIPLTLLTRQYGGINTTRLVASSKVLHHAIPTHNCDIIMTLPEKTDDVILMWLLARLRSRSPKIHVYVRHWKNTGMYAFYMTANYENLLKGAEQIGLRKPLCSEYGGGMRKFILEDRACYQGIEDDANFLTSRERQTILYHFLLNLRACPGEELGKLKFLEGQAIVPLLQTKRIISQVFPLHEQSSITILRRSWVQKFFSPQPLDKISEYFGVKISMYFAYLGHYTKALVVPTVIGIICWFLQAKNQELEDVCFLIFALFNVVWATIYTESWRRRSSEYAYRWGTLDKKAELLQDPRPLYTGDLVTSPVTGRLEPYYSPWKRNLFRYGVTVPVVLICLIIVFMVMLLIFELQEWVNGLVKNGDIPYFCQFVPKVLLAVSIGVLDEIYKKIATWLNDKENYRLDESYENHLIVKLVLFQFVNSFLSLFYIAFYLQDMDRLRDQLATLMITRQVIGNFREAVVPYILWKMRLIQVGYHITGQMSPHTLAKEVRDLTGRNPTNSNQDESSSDTGQGQEKDEIFYTDHSTTESLFSVQCPDESQPIQTDHDTDKLTPENTSCVDDVLPGNNVNKLSTESGNHGNHSSELTLTQAEIESTMKRYEDTFDDYLEMFIQYGYVILFSSAFPLAALCALLNNVIEIHSDAFKLCVYHQRPFGKRVRNIGIWQDALRVLGVVAVVVNSALIGVSGQMTRMVPGLDMTSIIIVILVIEHLMLVLKMLITYAIPSHPDWITQEMARLEFQRREALKSLETKFGSPLDIRARQSGSPEVNPIFNLKSPPKVPARHHSSDLALLTHSNQNISNKDGGSITSSSQSPQPPPPSSSSSFNATKSFLASSSTVPKSSKIPVNKLSNTLTGDHRLDNDDDRLINDNVESSSSIHSESLYSSTDISNTSTKSSTLPCSSSKVPGIRSSSAFGISNPEVRLQTRQRILQSAKSRQMESSLVTHRKPTGTS